VIRSVSATPKRKCTGATVPPVSGQPRPQADVEYARERVAEVLSWWHSIEVAPGVVTPGVKTPEFHAAELEMLRLPDLRGKSVLDVGGWDGFYAFHAEELGARRVAVLDSFGYTDVPGHEATFRHDGRQGLDVARELRASSVEPIVADFMTVPMDQVGTWDVVLFFGVLYHLGDPLGGLRRLAALARECAIVQTHAIAVAGNPDASLWEFYPSDELGDDPSNWFVPTARALEGALQAAGFKCVTMQTEPPQTHKRGPAIVRYSAVAHAYK
jgi:tRNA (mo5U34)-methyltransferase